MIWKDLEQQLEYSEEASPEGVWGRSGLHGGDSKCKGPGAGEPWGFLKENEETSVAEIACGNTAGQGQVVRSACYMVLALLDSHACIWTILGLLMRQLHPSRCKAYLLTNQGHLLLFSCSVVSDSAAPWTAAHQASLSFTISWNLFRLMSVESMTSSNYLIFCHPLLLLPSVFPSIRVFSNGSALHIRWPKYWRFSISPSNMPSKKQHRSSPAPARGVGVTPAELQACDKSSGYQRAPQPPCQPFTQHCVGPAAHLLLCITPC